MSDRLSYQQNAALHSACNAFVVRQFGVVTCFRTTQEVTRMIDDSISFVVFGLAVNEQIHLDMMALFLNENHCILFLEASSSIYISRADLERNMDEHNKQFPHSIGL